MATRNGVRSNMASLFIHKLVSFKHIQTPFTFQRHTCSYTHHCHSTNNLDCVAMRDWVSGTECLHADLVTIPASHPRRGWCMGVEGSVGVLLMCRWPWKPPAWIRKPPGPSSSSGWTSAPPSCSGSKSSSSPSPFLSRPTSYISQTRSAAVLVTRVRVKAVPPSSCQSRANAQNPQCP